MVTAAIRLRPAEHRHDAHRFLFIVSLLVREQGNVVYHALFQEDVPVFIRGVYPVEYHLFFFNGSNTFEIFI